ncbi:hypothetical protein A9993_12205 [Rahnella victoriana]|uniref:YdgH/BhsA/McbA-like domain containing protein n=1 Tax=Rahnella victoriana TaxID=1510570 RepID=UPI000BB1CE5D|nr:YdgH/BhsA/McbA-like domain containing protein [Rahnella victoriana]PBI80444.1 hypothetical protein A9993_12205 [Rahnella victoriana]
MKIFKMLATLVVLSAVSASSMAATLITKEDVKNNPQKYVRVGVVSTSATTMSPSDAKVELSKKADEKGGQYFVVTSGNNDNKVHATAIVYKDK